MSIDSAIAALSQALGDQVSTAQAIRDQHGANETHHATALPDAVVFARSTEDVATAVKLCAMHDCPIVAFGTGTSLEGQHLATMGGVSLDLSRMDKVLAVQPEDMLVVVQPGVTRVAVNDALRATGLFFPVDPGANASLGGMAATRASGTTAVRYGTMRENVLALEAVLADGTIVRTGTQARKSSTGYDLTHLLVGSEGTLGIITELTLRLHGQPEAVRAATCRFDTVEAAVNTVIVTIQSGIPMARIELVDALTVKGFNILNSLELPEVPHLFLEFHGSETAVAEQVTAFRALADEFGAQGFAEAAKTEDRSALWKMRHNVLYAHKSLAPEKDVLATDTCVPISRLAEAVTDAEIHARELGLFCPTVGHVGDGNFHCTVMFDRNDPAEVKKVGIFTEELAQNALRLGGTISGEHGIGLGKQKYMQAQHGPALDMMRAMKQALDPKGILNPGKLLPQGNR